MMTPLSIAAVRQAQGAAARAAGVTLRWAQAGVGAHVFLGFLRFVCWYVVPTAWLSTTVRNWLVLTVECGVPHLLYFGDIVNKVCVEKGHATCYGTHELPLTAPLRNWQVFLVECGVPHKHYCIDVVPADFARLGGTAVARGRTTRGEDRRRRRGRRKGRPCSVIRPPTKRTRKVVMMTEEVYTTYPNQTMCVFFLLLSYSDMRFVSRALGVVQKLCNAKNANF